jgi:uncharacterized phage protein gp47/JayE
MAVSFSALVQRASKSEILAKGLTVAEAVGLSVTSWAVGDPTRSLYHYLAELLESFEATIQPMVAAAALDFIPDDSLWLDVVGYQVYGVERIAATYAAPPILLTNTGGGYYEIAPRELTFKNAVTGKTYQNVTGGTLSPGPGTTLALDAIAEEEGADSSAAAGEIIEIVSAPLGVECTNPTAALALDKEEPAAYRARCKAKTGALSPNGPRDAYVYVAKTPALTGVTTVTRARGHGESATGTVTLYVAGATGPIPAPDLVLVQDAIVRWATPLCITPDVQNAAALSVPITYQIWLYRSVNREAAEIQTAIQTALIKMFALRPIGGDVIPPATAGALYRSLIISTIKSVYPDHTFRVEVTSPAADTALAVNQVPILGTLTPTVTFVQDP